VSTFSRSASRGGCYSSRYPNPERRTVSVPGLASEKATIMMNGNIFVVLGVVTALAACTAEVATEQNGDEDTIESDLTSVDIESKRFVCTDSSGNQLFLFGMSGAVRLRGVVKDVSGTVIRIPHDTWMKRQYSGGVKYSGYSNTRATWLPSRSVFQGVMHVGEQSPGRWAVQIVAGTSGPGPIERAEDVYQCNLAP
jgi:hypothetical protein